MNWKKFKGLKKAEKMDEAWFVLGIDIGNDSSAISFYDQSRGFSEIIDISGGYGRPSIPTVMQYISETKEWVFGEYAILNKGQGQEITMSSLMEQLGRREYLEIDKKPVAVVTIIGLFLKEIIGSVRNINPKAEIAGIVAAIPCYLSQEAREELSRAFTLAGYERELIMLAPDRECAFAYHFKNERPAAENMLLLDYGSREIRGGLYQITPSENETHIKSLSSLFEKEIGTKQIDSAVTKLLLKGFPHKLTPQLADQLSGFLYQHKDLLFQKGTRPAKLYMNFVYPPIQYTITRDTMEELIYPFKNMFYEFTQDVLDKSITEGLAMSSVKYILCTGGGFEMPWTKDALTDLFPDARILMSKNPKSVTAEGAALLAARMLDLLDDMITVSVEDEHQLLIDIGVNIVSEDRERFVPLVERNSFWWQAQPDRLFIVNNEKIADTYLGLLSRTASGDIREMERIPLSELPERPGGATRLAIGLRFENNHDISVTVRDDGFGEIFPKTDFLKTVNIDITGIAR